MMSKATEILDVIKKSVEEHPDFGYTTQTCYDPEKLDFKVSIGLIEKTDKGDWIRFTITVDDWMYYGLNQNKIVIPTAPPSERERLSEGVDRPQPPLRPMTRIIREGTIGDCLKCHSTTIKRFIWFGRKIGCIQPKCENYYKPKQ